MTVRSGIVPRSSSRGAPGVTRPEDVPLPCTLSFLLVSRLRARALCRLLFFSLLDRHLTEMYTVSSAILVIIFQSAWVGCFLLSAPLPLVRGFGRKEKILYPAGESPPEHLPVAPLPPSLGFPFFPGPGCFSVCFRFLVSISFDRFPLVE